MPIGGSTPTGALGYVACAQEILRQAAEREIAIDAIVHCTGSGATQAGLLVGLAGEGDDVAVDGGISVAETRDVIEARVHELAAETAAKLGAAPVPRERVEVLDGYVGPGYGLPTEGMREALELCARLEGLVLDPVYSGKAMAGLIDLRPPGPRSRPTRRSCSSTPAARPRFSPTKTRCWPTPADRQRALEVARERIDCDMLGVRQPERRRVAAALAVELLRRCRSGTDEPSADKFS